MEYSVDRYEVLRMEYSIANQLIDWSIVHTSYHERQNSYDYFVPIDLTQYSPRAQLIWKSGWR